MLAKPTAHNSWAVVSVSGKPEPCANNDDEQALGDQLYTALGLPLRGHWSTRKPKLMGHLHQYGTECLIVDDAHDLSLEYLMFIKEVTDQGRLQYDHPLGLCLVAAGRGTTIPLKETLDLPDPTWLQFRRRFDKLEPFCRIAGHTSEEVRDILATLETVKEQEQTNTSPNCTFSGELVPIDLKQFTDSGISLVECPHCSRTRSLSPVKGVLRFPSHTRRKQQTSLTSTR